jgi:membrane-associated protease RseP (regulator of RpoE activity)
MDRSPEFLEPVTFLRSSDGRDSVLSDYRPPVEVRDRVWLHILLFVLTLASTVYSGGVIAGRLFRYSDLGAWWFVPDGLLFGLSLLLFLTVHEFGHFFAARFHGVRTSLPYYIPAPLIGFGTLGAVIRIREPIPTIRKLFDIGAAGPVAGFVVAVALLLYALATLPPPTYLFDLPGHEAIKLHIQQHGEFPEGMVGAAPGQEGMTLVVGQTLLYWFATQFFENVPPMYEIYHYPVLFAAWLGLFFTALNLLPVGQLDGGHILYALVGPRWHALLARIFVVLLLTSGAIGFASDAILGLQTYGGIAGGLSWFILAGILYLYLNRVFERNLRLIAPVLLGMIGVTALALLVGEPLTRVGYSGWLIFGLLIVFLIRVDHPPVMRREPLTPGRRVLAIAGILMFVLCFSVRPLYFV